MFAFSESLLICYQSVKGHFALIVLPLLLRMKILLHYLSRYKGLVIVSFLLATFNIGFSLCDPIVYGWLIDRVIEGLA